MKVAELFASLGLDVNAASFLKGQLAVDGVRWALRQMLDMARTAFRTFLDVGAVISAADHIDELAQTIGVSTDALQELAYAGSFSSLSMDDMGQALGFLQKNLLNAKDGSKETGEVFRKLGVRVKESDGTLRNADAVLMDVAEAFASGLVPESERAVTAMKVFGKSGKAMVPFLLEGKAGVAELRAEAQRLGIVLDESTIKAGVEADDSMQRFKSALTGVRNTLVSAAIPAITKVVNRITEWVAQNKPLIKQIGGTLVSALRAVWTVLSGVGTVLGVAIRYWKLLAVITAAYVAAVLIPQIPVLALVAAGYVQMGIAAVGSAVAAAAAWLVAAAPVILIAALIALAVLAFEDLYQWITGGRSVIGDWLGDWDKASKAIKMMWQDAIGWVEKTLDRIWAKVKAVASYLKGEFGEGTEQRSSAAFHAAERARAGGAGLGERLRAMSESVATVSAPPSVSAASVAGAPVSKVETTKSVAVAPGGIVIQQQPGESQADLSVRVKEAITTFWDDKLEAAVP